MPRSASRFCESRASTRDAYRAAFAGSSRQPSRARPRRFLARRPRRELARLGRRRARRLPPSARCRPKDLRLRHLHNESSARIIRPVHARIVEDDVVRIGLIRGKSDGIAPGNGGCKDGVFVEVRPLNVDRINSDAVGVGNGHNRGWAPAVKRSQSDRSRPGFTSRIVTEVHSCGIHSNSSGVAAAHR